MSSLRAVTMADVACRASVSASTVSRALRHHPAIPEPTRRRVMAAAEQLGYRPSPMLGTLMSQVRRRLPETETNFSCLFQEHHEPNLRRAQRDILEGFRTAAHRLGYGADVDTWPLAAGQTLNALERQWQARGVAGVFLHNIHAESPLRLPWERYCWVVSGNISGAPKLHRVGNEIHQLVKLAVEKALQAGYSKPGLAVPLVGERREGLRWAGAFYASSLDFDLPPASALIFRSTWREKDFQVWLAKTTPDVVIGLSDEVNQWLSRASPPSGVRPGFIHLAANTSPLDVPGVVQDFRATGAAAAQMLDSLVRRNEPGVPERPNTLTVAGTWKEAGGK